MSTVFILIALATLVYAAGLAIATQQAIDLDAWEEEHRDDFLR